MMINSLTTEQSLATHVVLLYVFALALCIGWLLPGVASAYSVVMVTPPEVDSYTTVDKPDHLRAYFGTLTGFPHTYRFVLDAAREVTFQIAEPAIVQPAGSPSVIVVREVERGVEEVARLNASEVGKETETVYSTGDTYRLGERFTQTLEPGAYLVEVSNGDNDGRYVLRMGTEPVEDGLGYFGTLKQIYTIKQFFNKPAIYVLQSPYYYVPLLLSSLGGLWWYRRRQKITYA